MLFDLHNDYLTANKEEQAAADIGASGLRAVIFAVWASRARFTESEYFALLDNTPKDCAFRRLTAIEDIGSMQISDYDAFLCQARPAYVSLTWNGAGRLAGGVGSDGGLTDEGKAVLDAMSRQSMVLDLAHLNERSFWQALDYYDGRVIVSHTGIKDAYHSERNLSFSRMCGVCQKGGIIGIFAAANFISEDRCTVNDLAVHILKAVTAVGADAVCIGTDFCGAERYPEGFSGYGDCEKLHAALERAGLTNNQINKILYSSAESFFGWKENE